ncbi:hypothetical protein M3Y97_00473200 [Aphelenchoides bicaudatus]|nr:hypothetical protein M3Y97_00473200 [Aphelenchoides bicaudatus]
MKLAAIFAALFLIVFASGAEVLFKPNGRFFDKKFRLLVEDFVDKTDVQQQTEIDELLIGVSLANQTNGHSERFYSTAFRNLKHILPNLQTLTIDGGYILKPAFGTADELRAEIAYLNEHMNAVINAAHEHNIVVPSFIVGIGYLFDTKIADQVNLYQLLVENFNAAPIKDPKLYEYTMSFQRNGVRCDLAVTVSGMDTPTVPKGRTVFTAFTRLPNATMDTVARLYYNHIRISGRFDP